MQVPPFWFLSYSGRDREIVRGIERYLSQYGVRTFFDRVPIDLIIVRENTESLYAGIEFERGKPETADIIEYINTHSKSGKVKTGREETGESCACARRLSSSHFYISKSLHFEWLREGAARL